MGPFLSGSQKARYEEQGVMWRRVRARNSIVDSVPPEIRLFQMESLVDDEDRGSVLRLEPVRRLNVVADMIGTAGR